jgi:hypothetical protein
MHVHWLYKGIKGRNKALKGDLSTRITASVSPGRSEFSKLKHINTEKKSLQVVYIVIGGLWFEQLCK